MPTKYLPLSVCLALISMGSISVPLKNDETGSPLTEMQQTVHMLRQIDRFDRQRRLETRKIVHIIQRFNVRLSNAVATKLADEIFGMAMKYPNLDVDLISATITHESARTWDPEIVSSAGALGLMQIMPNTGRWLANQENIPWTSSEEILFNPIYNIRLGCRYLSALIESYDLEGGLAAYNGGATRARMWLASNKEEGILWAETREYVPLVLKLYDEYRNLSM